MARAAGRPPELPATGAASARGHGCPPPRPPAVPRPRLARRHRTIRADPDFITRCRTDTAVPSARQRGCDGDDPLRAAPSAQAGAPNRDETQSRNRVTLRAAARHPFGRAAPAPPR
jgi:hypothetical protein